MGAQRWHLREVRSDEIALNRGRPRHGPLGGAVGRDRSGAERHPGLAVGREAHAGDLRVVDLPGLRAVRGRRVRLEAGRVTGGHRYVGRSGVEDHPLVDRRVDGGLADDPHLLLGTRIGVRMDGRPGEDPVAGAEPGAGGAGDGDGTSGSGADRSPGRWRGGGG